MAIRHLTYIGDRRTIRVANEGGERRISPYRYTRTDFDRVLEFVRRLYEPRTPEAFSEHLVSALRELVPNEIIVSGSIDIGTGSLHRTRRSNPPEFAHTEFDAVLARYAWESPMVVHFKRTHTEQFVRWSDLQPSSQFRRSALYNEAYRPLGIKDCCTLLFHVRPDFIEGTGVCLHKQIPDAHRDILVSISPHLRQAFRFAHTNSALIEMAAMKSGPNCTERGIVAIGVDGTIAMETAAATRSIEKFFPQRPGRGLPEQLTQWISWSDPMLRRVTDVPEVRRPLVIERAGNRLTVHLLSTPERNFLMLEEHRLAIDPAALSSLPLTRRESEILAYVAIGKTNPEIGIILGISSRTVSKHMEHIRNGLGVETRTAAAAMALEAANL